MSNRKTRENMFSGWKDLREKVEPGRSSVLRVTPIKEYYTGIKLATKKRRNNSYQLLGDLLMEAASYHQI